MICDRGDIKDWFDAPGWNQETVNNNNHPDIPNRIQWRRGQNKEGDIMLNTDIALVREYSEFQG